MVKKRQFQSKPKTETQASPWQNPLVWILAVLLLGALALRVVLAHQLEYPQVDGTYYLDQARELVGRGYLPHSSFPPGFPLLISLVLLGLDINDPLAPLRAAQTVNVVFGTLFGLLTFVFLRKKFPDTWALVGAAIVLFLPHAVFYSKIDMSEMTYACFLLGGWLIWDRGRQFCAGLLFGYAYLIRPEVLLIPAALGLLRILRDRQFPWRLALGVLIPVIPYLIFLKIQSGHWTLSSKGVFLSLALEGNPGLSLTGLLVGNIRDMVGGLFGLLGLPLVLLTLVGAWRAENRWYIALLPLITLPLFPFPMLPRFWLPYLPFLLMGVGLGIQFVSLKFPRSRSRPAIMAGSLIVLIGLGVAVRDDAYLYTKRQEVYPNLREAGLWLRDRVTRDTIIAAYKSQPSYWAWARFAKCPADRDVVGIIDAVKADGARFLVVDVYTSMYFHPELLKLLRTPDSLPPELESRVSLVYIITSEADYRRNLCVYEIK